MRLIVGLGNIGSEYEHTRHNIGFDVIDLLARELNISFSENKSLNSYVGTGFVNGNKVILAKPTTYMNLSGDAVSKLMNYYKLDIEDLLVIHDDLDLPIGSLRVRHQGSAGGQKGMNHIIQCLGTQKIQRLRVGIGKDPKIPVVNYVLGHVSKEDAPVYQQGIDKAQKAAYAFADNQKFDMIMNQYNQK